MTHLVRNAVDHGIETPRERRAAGKPAEATLTVRARSEEHEVVVEVSDNGRGIDVDRVARTALEQGLVTPEELGALGDDEVVALVLRSGLSTAREVTSVYGRGYGLDVVRTDISGPGQRRAGQHPGSGLPGAAAAAARRRGGAMKIVVADDSRVMRQIVIRAMRQAGHTGHTFLEAADGDAAFELVRAESPELVLSDWNMPGTSGLDLLRRLRACGETVTFGFVTSESSHDMRRRAYDAGAQFLIGKPFGADDFREVLGPALSEEETAATDTSLPARRRSGTCSRRCWAATSRSPPPARWRSARSTRRTSRSTSTTGPGWWRPRSPTCRSPCKRRRSRPHPAPGRRRGPPVPAAARPAARRRRRGPQRRLHAVQPRRCAARAAALDLRPRRTAAGRRGRGGAHPGPPPGPARRRGDVRRRAAGPGARALTV